MSEAFKLNPHEWALLRSLLDEALALPATQRGPWLQALDEARAQGLKPRLQSLLAIATDGELATGLRLLETLPKVETGQFAPPPGGATEQPGDTVGPYRLIRELGSGGMASVWLAERTDMLHGRQVALKLPHGAWKRAGLAERMAREREILATLEHPNIARLYDAGLAEDGQPWLALEYVHGVRIDDWCRANDPSVPARLRLFLQVAQAMAHAHAQLVVHRDLKPGNILVTAEGGVKLLDFGIAKLLQEGVVEETELTRGAGRALTPEYASPEQVLGRPLGTASDIYSLGVVLFEMLADERPYRLRQSSWAALEAAVANAEVPRPSSVAPAARRAALRGDLDTIVLKALRREPAERYATVAALAEDVQRHLDHRPVLAQPERRAYVWAKFVRRNRVAVATAAAVGMAVAAGAGVSLWQAAAARQERDRAEQAKTFLVSMFEGLNPDAAGSARNVLATQVLDRATAQLPSEEPLRSELILALARARMGLYDYASALALTEPAAAAAMAPDAPATQQELRWARAHALKQVHRLDEAEAQLKPLLALPAARTTPELGSRVRVLEAEIASQRGQYERARELGLALLAHLDAHPEHLRGGQRPYADDHRTRAHLVLSIAHGQLRDRAKSLEHSSAAHAIQQRTRPNDRAHPMRLAAGQYYGADLIGVGRYEEAAPLLQQLLDDARAVHGQDNWLVPEFASRLAIVEAERGQFQRSVQLLGEAVRAMDAVALPDTLAKVGILRTVGRSHMRDRRYAAAVPPLDRALAILAKTPSPFFARVVGADRAYAAAMAGSLPPEQALTQLQRIVAEQDSLAPKQRSYVPLHHLGRLQGLNGATLQALDTLRMAEPLARTSPRRLEVAEALTDLALAMLDAAPTADLEARTRATALLDEAQALLDTTNARNSPTGADLATGRARMALAAGDAAQALAAAKQADEHWRSAGAQGRDAGVAAHWLARALEASGQAEAARGARQRAAALLSASPFVADARLRAAR